MTRSSSIFGSLLGLIGACLRRRPLLVIGAVAVCALWWRDPGSRGDRGPRPAAQPQVAVVRDGFAILDGDPRRVTELDRAGAPLRSAAVAVPADARVIGIGSATALGWLQGEQVHTARVDRDGKLREQRAWGRDAVRLCGGVASNDVRGAIGWIERDGDLWFVHGPVARGVEAVAAAEVAGAAPPATVPWCHLASAGDQIMLLWRQNGRVMLNHCSARECGGLPARVSKLEKATVLGFGCVRDGCAIAIENGDDLDVQWVRRNGKVDWTRRIGDADPDGGAQLVGVGTDRIAVGYRARGRHLAAVTTVTTRGVVAPLVEGPRADAAPSVAWSRGQLVVASSHRGVLSTQVVALR